MVNGMPDVDPDRPGVEPSLDIYFTSDFESMARNRLKGWRDWAEVRGLIEWALSQRMYSPTPVRGTVDNYTITFNLTDQVRRVSTWVFEFELNDVRTRQANAVDIRREAP